MAFKNPIYPPPPPPSPPKKKINTGENFHRAVVHQLCWFGPKSKFKIWTLNFQQMEVYFEVPKIIEFTTYKYIITDVQSMSISFSVRHPHKFQDYLQYVCIAI